MNGWMDGWLPRDLNNIFLASFYFLVFYDRVGLHSSTTEGCPGMRARVCVLCVIVVCCLYLDFVSRVLGRAGFRTGQAGQIPRGLYNQGASSYFLSLFICFVF